MFIQVRNFVTKNKHHTFVALLELIIVIYFFRELFWPEPKIFFTPELTGRSDILNFFYPIKKLLSDSLKEGGLPLWSKYAAGGYPVFAEGQIGTFNLTNVILFGTLPTLFALNLSYVIIFLTSFFGSYLLFSNKGLSKTSSMFSALAYSFGGYFIGHVAHFSLIQAMSFMPWLILYFQKLWIAPNKKPS